MHEGFDAGLERELLLAALAAERPLYIARTDGGLAFANAGLTALFGAAAGRELGAERQAAVARVAALQEATASEEFTLDGRRVVGTHTPVRDGAGRLVGVVGRYEEAGREARLNQALVEERRRFRDFARAHSDWIWETDAAGRLVYLSENAAALLGVPTQLLRGRALLDVLQRAQGRETLAAALGRSWPFRDIVVEWRDEEDTGRALDVCGVPWFDVNGAFAGFRGTCHDITDRLAAERALERAHGALQESHRALAERNLELDRALVAANAATRAKDNFLAAMSHELRTPLNAILGMAEIMHLGLFGPLSGRYQGYAQDMMKAGGHLLRLIDDVLDTARIEADRLPLTAGPVELSELLRDAVTMVERRAAERQVDLSAVRGGSGWQLMVDRTRTLQVITNLLANAVKFTPVGGSVGVDTMPAPGRPNEVEIAVWDSGAGVPTDKREEIFEPFNRGGRDAMNEPSEGAGLGLALARKLARLMGGDLRLAPTPGRASRFVLRLPLVIAPRRAAEVARYANAD